MNQIHANLAELEKNTTLLTSRFVGNRDQAKSFCTPVFLSPLSDAAKEVAMFGCEKCVQEKPRFTT